MTELLSPAGNKESFFAAINSGANAVYLGLDDFSARKSAENFSRENLSYYIDYAHALLGIKVYVALNTLVKNEETERFLEYAAFCNAAGVDGVILQDIFLGKLLKARFPDLPLHLSTQAGVNNADGARLAKEFGFSRVVLSRETPIEEIKKISGIIETECFIQGALCTAFSGQCYMSGFAGNMSGNRGLCKQPCRKKYTIKNGNETREGYLISLADLSIGKDIFSLIDAGVTSFKIEGRMRKPSFVAAATRYYRNLLDGETPSISALTRTFNRGDYTKGLGFGQDKNLISDKIQSHKGELAGTIRSIKNGIITAESSRSFVPGDSGKIIRNGFEAGSFTCDKTGVLRASGSAARGDELNITTDVNLETELLNRKITLNIDVTARFLAGKNAFLSARSGDTIVTVESETPLEKAIKAPLSEEDVKNALDKTDEYPFDITLSLETDGVFLAKSKLNELRRALYQKLYASLTEKPVRKELPFAPSFKKEIASKGIIVLDDDFSFINELSIDCAVFCPSDYGDNGLIDEFFEKTEGSACERYLYIPNKFSSADERVVSSIIKRFDGLYVEGSFGIELTKRYGVKLILGTGANVYNSFDVAEAKNYADKICLSKELSLSEAKELDGYYYSLGAIKVMDLLYCPFKKECAACKRGDLSTLFDGEREFIVRRVKMNGCRFEVYNCATLVTKNRERAVINLVTIQKDKKLAALKALGDKKVLKEIFENFTTGHENKPLA